MPCQHLANFIVVAYRESEDTHPLFGLVCIKPIDGPVDGQVAKARQQIVMALAPKRRRRQPAGFLPDCPDAGFAVIQRGFNAFPEAELAFEQMVEDQGEIMLGFRRKLNFEPHERGASG